MASASTLFFNDLDILEHIPFHIPNIKGLTAFRRINQTCSTASRHHVEYHTIECSLDHDDLWESLAEKPGLAIRVRRLVIMESADTLSPSQAKDKRQIIPPKIKPQPFPEGHPIPETRESIPEFLKACSTSERLLCRAISRMANLEYFDWDALPPVLYPSLKSDGSENVDLWGTLGKLSSLKELHLIDSTAAMHIPQWRRMGSPSIISSGVSR